MKTTLVFSNLTLQSSSVGIGVAQNYVISFNFKATELIIAGILVLFCGRWSYLMSHILLLYMLLGLDISRFQVVKVISQSSPISIHRYLVTSVCTSEMTKWIKKKSVTICNLTQYFSELPLCLCNLKKNVVFKLSISYSTLISTDALVWIGYSEDCQKLFSFAACFQIRLG